jgi:HPr kinase/phosphorylase
MSVVRLNELMEKMRLTNLTPEIDPSRIKIRQPDINRPAIQLTGYFEHFAGERLQICGLVEHAYMDGMEEARKREIYSHLLSFPIPAVMSICFAPAWRAFLLRLMRICEICPSSA